MYQLLSSSLCFPAALAILQVHLGCGGYKSRRQAKRMYFKIGNVMKHNRYSIVDVD